MTDKDGKKMEPLARKQTAKLLQRTAKKVQEGKVQWVFCAIQFDDGRATFATKHAPNRPKGISS